MSGRLTEPQRRHLRELYGDGGTTLYWHTGCATPEHRCAEALARKGLVVFEGSVPLRSGGGYYLTAAGREVAATMWREAQWR